MKRTVTTWPLAILLVIVLVLVLYVLSVGPAAALEENEVISNAVFEYVYAPLIWLCDNSATVLWILESYVGLWWKPFG